MIFVHPGKDASNDGNVDVYVKYLKGTFSFVSNYNELKLNKTKKTFICLMILIVVEKHSHLVIMLQKNITWKWIYNI
ncbi:MAG: hypothetical protein L6U99_14685 [Clostridium sp.]|nr:MAG: hypothetical protein L6U99_14685 [Clostridium sp.]